MTQGPPQKTTLLFTLRVTAMDFIYVWLMICFLRLFVVENYRVPTGSMTPTLVGGTIAQLDVNQDGLSDYVLRMGRGYEIFINAGQDFLPCTDYPPSPQFKMELEALRKSHDDNALPEAFFSWLSPLELRKEAEARLRTRYDNILVDKTRYWFASPQRGDIAVFKPPRSIYQRTAPVYVKRVVGLPGETAQVRDNHLWVDGKPVASPEFFRRHYYTNVCEGRLFTGQTQGSDEYLFFGDNTLNSSDGRYWGPVPRDNIRGKVFFRYWPLKAGGFVR